MKPRLNPPDVSAVVPPPHLHYYGNGMTSSCQLDSNQSSYYGLQEMGAEGGEERGPLANDLLSLSIAPDGHAATLPRLSLLLFH